MTWEALTGRRLFTSDTPLGSLKQITDRALPSPQSVAEKLPPRLSAVVYRSLEQDPERRFPTAYAYRQALIEADPRSR